MALVKIDLKLQKIEKFMADISWAVCVALTIMIVSDIFLRYVFDWPLPASWEISEISYPGPSPARLPW